MLSKYFIYNLKSLTAKSYYKLKLKFINLDKNLKLLNKINFHL